MGSAFFMTTFFLAYIIAFYIGSLFIYHQVENTILNKVYSSSDIMICFFGMIFGSFSLALMGPSFTAMAEGRAAGMAAFETLNRQSQIDAENPKGKHLLIEGKIEFKNVDFYYPTKTE